MNHNKSTLEKKNYQRLLVYSLNKHTTEDLRRTVAETLKNPIDLDDFFTTAEHHGILPLIHAAWNGSCLDLIPEPVVANIKKKVRLIGISNLGKASALIQFLALLAQHTIPAVPFKGPLLACNLYNNLSLRSFCDLDVLVDIKDVTSAYGVLRKSGYDPEVEFSRAQLEHLIRTEDNLNFIHSQSGFIVELHWEISGRCLPHPLTLNLFQPRLIDSKILHHTVQSLSNEDLLIYLCIHGSKHIWSRLEWLFSVHEIVRQNRNLDWDLIFLLAEQWSAKRMLAVGLLAAQHLFETEFPESVRKKINSDQHAVEMAESVSRMFLIPKENDTVQGENTRFTFWQLKCMDSNRARLRLILTMLFNPTIEDYRRFTFPEKLAYLYYVCRPLRLCWEGIKQSV